MKVGFVGAGKIGANSVYSTLHRCGSAIDEIAIVDIVENLAVGEAIDLNTAAAGLGLKTKVVGGSDYKLLSGADLVVVSAGLPRKPGMTREDLLKTNADITKKIGASIKEHAPGAMVLEVANPVDALTYVLWKVMGKPRGEVFGMGALHDSMRLWDILRDSGASFYDAWILGPHGEDMFPARSIAAVRGANPDWAAIQEQVRKRAAFVIEKKGATYYAPGIAVSQMVDAVVNNRRALLPAIAVLQGEYGLRDLAIGVPAILGRGGLERVVELPLGKEDLTLLHKGAETLKKQIASLSL
ncbi:MAG: lactate/malate family dehydrogenase [Methanobacteriota archaeon]